MRAVAFDAFGEHLYIKQVDVPVARPHGVVIKVAATG
jgi:D-arabinose 1-dehydrogenase-like Zn-dependent alcohol dehydrogenase